MLLFCCTCGRGMKALAANQFHCQEGLQLQRRHPENDRRLNLSKDYEDVEGKIFFTSSDDITAESIFNLRLVERAFLVVSHWKGSPPTTESALIHLVEENISQIQRMLDVWKDKFYDGAQTEGSRKRRHCDEEDSHRLSSSGTTGNLCIRVSVKVTGSYRSLLQQDALASSISALLSQGIHGYEVTQGQATTTFNVMCSDELIMLAVQVSKQPLSLRHYIRSPGLRSTTCAAMVMLASIQPGDVVLDPLCGAGTILLEAANICPQAIYIGMDIDTSQLSQAMNNSTWYRQVVTDRPLTLQLLLGNVKTSCLRPASVDVILTDLPFGQKHQVSGDLGDLYLHCCLQFTRLLKAGGKVVVLTSNYMLSSLRSAAKKARLCIINEHFLTLGRTEAYIVTMCKSSEPTLECGDNNATE